MHIESSSGLRSDESEILMMESPSPKGLTSSDSAGSPELVSRDASLRDITRFDPHACTSISGRDLGGSDSDDDGELGIALQRPWSSPPQLRYFMLESDSKEGRAVGGSGEEKKAK